MSFKKRHVFPHMNGVFRISSSETFICLYEASSSVFISRYELQIKPMLPSFMGAKLMVQLIVLSNG